MTRISNRIKQILFNFYLLNAKIQLHRFVYRTLKFVSISLLLLHLNVSNGLPIFRTTCIWCKDELIVNEWTMNVMYGLIDKFSWLEHFLIWCKIEEHAFSNMLLTFGWGNSSPKVSDVPCYFPLLSWHF